VPDVSRWNAPTRPAGVVTAPARTAAQAFRENTVVVVLPIPDSGIGPNGRDLWYTKAGKVKDHRAWGSIATTEAMQPEGPRMWPAARLDIEWRWCGSEPDADGCVARIKHYIDGAQDAGLVTNDRHVSIGSVERVRVPHKPDACVVLTFHRTGEAA
jgi:hypothetical protein